MLGEIVLCEILPTETGFAKSCGCRSVISSGDTVGPFYTSGSMLCMWGRVTNDSPPPTHHLRPDLYIGGRSNWAATALSRITVVTATSHWTTELFSYPEKHFSKLAHRLRDWRIAINVSKSAPMLFINTARRNQYRQPVHLPGDPIPWVDSAQ